MAFDSSCKIRLIPSPLLKLSAQPSPEVYKRCWLKLISQLGKNAIHTCWITVSVQIPSDSFFHLPVREEGKFFANECLQLARGLIPASVGIHISVLIHQRLCSSWKLSLPEWNTQEIQGVVERGISCARWT